VWIGGGQAAASVTTVTWAAGRTAQHSQAHLSIPSDAMWRGEEEGEEVMKGLFETKAMNEEKTGRDRATPGGGNSNRSDEG